MGPRDGITPCPTGPGIYQDDIVNNMVNDVRAWWHHQMETFATSLAICAGNYPVTGESPSQRPVTWSFDGVFDLRLNKQLSKQSWGWWFDMQLRPLWQLHDFLINSLSDDNIFITVISILKVVLENNVWSPTAVLRAIFLATELLVCASPHHQLSWYRFDKRWEC